MLSTSGFFHHSLRCAVLKPAIKLTRGINRNIYNSTRTLAASSLRKRPERVRIASGYLSSVNVDRAAITSIYQQPRFKFSTGGQSEKWTDLSFEDLIALLESHDIQLFDVREPKEIQASGAIVGAVNIPLGAVKEALQMADVEFYDRFKVSKPQKHDTNIVFYGLGPIKSSAALELAHKIGFKKARHYSSGYEEWCTLNKTKVKN